MAPIVDRFGSLRGGRDGAIAQLGERVVRNDEVGGSIPPGSTSLRRLRLLRLRQPLPETPSPTRQDDDAAIVVAGGSLHGVAHVALHDLCPRIHAVRPVERGSRSSRSLVENM